MIRGRLSTKFFVLGGILLLLALLSIGFTMWVTRQIDGGAGAVNEAGRLRMQAWNLASAQLSAQSPLVTTQAIERFDATMRLLRDGDRQRPLFVPWNEETRRHFGAIENSWQSIRAGVAASALRDPMQVMQESEGLVDEINRLVTAIEQTLARLTALLNLFQFIMMALAVSAAVLSLYVGYLFVLHPLKRIRHALQQVEAGDFSARVSVDSSDELGELAAGFNHMAQRLNNLYQGLERQVAAKTEDLRAERARLAALYEVSTLLSEATTMEALAQGFASKVRQLSRADAVAVRWSDEASRRYLMLASDGLPDELVQEERCIEAGLCACGQPEATARTRVIPIIPLEDRVLGSCARAGYVSLVSVPIRLQHRVLGEVDLFYRRETTLDRDERSLYDALAGHLANAVENLRREALVREAAVSEERAMLARELHDSIAQSLAFLKIQISLLRQALQRDDGARVQQVIDELDAGVRESTNDVRELLVHFRTRTSDDDIEEALRTTLNKFEHQSGLRAHLELHGHAVGMPSDVQLQVLHVIQEALSNVRKHAQASEVWVRVDREPAWRFSVRDNGQGFTPAAPSADDTHVGLQIMRERAQRIGAKVDIVSRPGQGTEVQIALETP